METEKPDNEGRGAPGARPLLSRAPGVMEARISDDELVLLGGETEDYFGLDAIGADVWSRLETPMTFDGLVEALAGDYDAPVAVIAEDLRPVIDTLLDGGLLRRDGAGA